MDITVLGEGGPQPKRLPTHPTLVGFGSQVASFMTLQVLVGGKMFSTHVTFEEALS